MSFSINFFIVPSETCLCEKKGEMLFVCLGDFLGFDRNLIKICGIYCPFFRDFFHHSI